MNSSLSSWQKAIADEWQTRRAADEQKPSILFPLAMNPFGQDEILAMTEVLLSGRLTLDQQVDKAEKKFAQMLGVPYAVMVNSGSSANLLAVSAMGNKLRTPHCRTGDHVLVPAVCWSTSVFPLLQNGLQPVFVDVNPHTFNVTIEELQKKLTPQVKAVMAVHVLGNSIDMRQLMKFVQENHLILVEDTCESLGTFCLDSYPHEHSTESSTKPQQQMLGTFGDFGTFSFYFSHHITSGEGGMVTCKTEEDYNLLRCLRAHGWTRHLTNRHQVEQSYPEFDSRFLFVNIGYNLRPLEVQGAMINIQLDKLTEFNACRRDNLYRIRQAFHQNPRIASILSLMEPSAGVDPAWFGVAALLHRPYAHQRSQFLEYLEKNGIENRPIISGNFIRQPCIQAFCENERPENYPGSEAVHTRGFFIGVHQIPLEQKVIEQLVKIILDFPFYPQHVILVTGHSQPIHRYLFEQLRQDSNPNVSSPPTIVETKDAEWIFLTAKDGDLRRIDDVVSVFKRFQPTRILHCASFIPSSEDVTKKPVDFWLDHVTLNNNILKTAFDFQTWVGPIKVLSLFSANIFSSTVDPSTNPYAYAQQSLLQLTHWYRQQHRCNFTSMIADSIFGPHDDFTSYNSINDSSILSLIAKISQQKSQNPSKSLILSGSKTQVHHGLFAKDLIEMIVWAMFHYDDDQTLFLPGSSASISECVQMISEQLGFVGGVSFDDDSKNTPSVDEIQKRFNAKVAEPSPISMTPLATAIRETLQHAPVHHR